jgi:DNA polymerase-3 subunit alpha
LASASDVTVGQLLSDEQHSEGAVVTVAGLITSVVRKTTKKSDPYAVITLEDLEGTLQVMVFPAAYQSAAAVLVEDSVVLVRGRIRREGDDAVKLMALDVTVPDLARGANSGPVIISVPTLRVTPPVVDQLKEVLATHPGAAEVHLRLQSAGRTMVMRLDERLRVTPTPALMADLKALLGPACLSA